MELLESPIVDRDEGGSLPKLIGSIIFQSLMGASVVLLAYMEPLLKKVVARSRNCCGNTLLLIRTSLRPVVHIYVVNACLKAWFLNSLP